MVTLTVIVCTIWLICGVLARDAEAQLRRDASRAAKILLAASYLLLMWWFLEVDPRTTVALGAIAIGGLALRVVRGVK